MNRPERNPFCKQFFNLTKQAEYYQGDRNLFESLKQEAVIIDAEAERMKHTRTLSEFNAMDRNAQIHFIQGGGSVT